MIDRLNNLREAASFIHFSLYWYKITLRPSGVYLSMQNSQTNPVYTQDQVVTWHELEAAEGNVLMQKLVKMERDIYAKMLEDKLKARFKGGE